MTTNDSEGRLANVLQRQQVRHLRTLAIEGVTP